MKYFLISILFAGCAGQIMAQHLFSINETADIIEVDQQQHIYIVNGATLKKYTPTGELLFSYSEKLNGVVANIDVTNPLRILVFYKESNKIVFLNKQLSPISDVGDIYSMIDLELAVAGVSSNAGFWAYNFDKQSVIHVSDKWEISIETANLSGWVSNDDVLFIREVNQQVYLGLLQKILVFDIYGSYITTIHFKDSEILNISGSKVAYKKQGYIKLRCLGEKLIEEVVVRDLIEDKNYMWVDKTRIYEVTKTHVKVHKW